MSQFSTMTTGERKMQAAAICREIQPHEGKQEGHAYIFQRRQMVNFISNAEIHAFKDQSIQSLLLSSFRASYFKAGTTAWFK